MSKETGITNLKFYSKDIRKKKYSLLKKSLPYLVVTSLFLLGMNHLGFYLDDGKVMLHSTSESFSFSKDSILYYGKWQKSEEGYCREKIYYDVDSIPSETAIEYIKNFDPDKLTSYLVNYEVIYQKDISLINKLFNDIDITYYDDNYGQMDKYSVENFSNNIDIFLVYLFVQFAVTVFKGDVSDAIHYIASKKRGDDKIVDISKYRKKRKK